MPLHQNHDDPLTNLLEQVIYQQQDYQARRASVTASQVYVKVESNHDLQFQFITIQFLIQKNYQSIDRNKYIILKILY